MKMIQILTAVALCTGLNAYAAKQTLVCQNGNGIQGRVQIDLDDSGYDAGSGYTEAVNGTIGYEYSSVGRMVCEGLIQNLNFDVTCVGLWAGFREPTVVTLKTTKGMTTAHWQTEKAYGSKAMSTDCVVK
jgi:hypothetical protein